MRVNLAERRPSGCRPAVEGKRRMWERCLLLLVAAVLFRPGGSTSLGATSGVLDAAPAEVVDQVRGSMTPRHTRTTLSNPAAISVAPLPSLPDPSR